MGFQKQVSPETKVTKLQAIIVASRLLPETDAYENIKLPYKDIQNFKWAEKFKESILL